MASDRTFYYLSSKSMDPCFLTRADAGEAFRTLICYSCKTPRPGVKNIDVVLEGRRSPNSPLNIVFAAGVGIARRDFLEALGMDTISRSLYLGHVSDEKG